MKYFKNKYHHHQQKVQGEPILCTICSGRRPISCPGSPLSTAVGSDVVPILPVRQQAMNYSGCWAPRRTLVYILSVALKRFLSIFKAYTQAVSDNILIKLR